MNPISFVILFMIVGQACVAQQHMDTTISRHIFDSIKTENFKLKYVNKRLEYRNRFLTKLETIDTLQVRNDSIVIRYMTKEKTLLKRIIKTYYRPDCQESESEEFFNDRGLPEYLEYWSCDCRSQEDVADDEKVFTKVLARYEQFVYDDHGRVIARVFIYSSRMPGPRRLEYQYDEDGKVTSRIKRISDNEFWD